MVSGGVSTIGRVLHLHNIYMLRSNTVCLQCLLIRVSNEQQQLLGSFRPLKGCIGKHTRFVRSNPARKVPNAGQRCE
ncbi:hypothetical protein BAUCODRAFT_564236 [Baudoinia panamericana UAMH 10762]|uniref:Uncharacterized protein n=1 Tax=Baudoinia panamericana (strain UAMH 10762) TaxID=717646 RepID=M2N6Y6_BAUPA|nr:uncharacterized protein BAUCODRAFT_564236 [Baudoinia panamericana UAMH 10762]EMC94849.1 hypothetical protein BAUCODRAFT_564236 [Baudoinia panamericana UAMH 10762]